MSPASRPEPASPARASGSSVSRIRVLAGASRPSVHASWALRPFWAAPKKLVCASSNRMCPLMSPYSDTTPDTSPNQNAALATSSTTVGPEGSTRFSIRR